MKVKEGNTEVYLVKEKVTIMPKDNTVLPGDNFKTHKNKIGASMGLNGKSITGFSLEEEMRFLPTIVKTKPNSEHWETAVEHYAANISKIVDPENGLALDISMKFTDEASAKKYEERLGKLPTDRNIKDYHKKYVDIISDTHGGVPGNLADYALWRYCLVYGKVANEIDDRNRSNNIWFYIKDDNLEKSKKMNLAQMRDTAYAIYLKTKDNLDDVKRILRLVGKDLKGRAYSINQMDEIDISMAFQEIANEQPNLLIEYTSKGFDFKTAAFIEECIEFDLLEVIPNTQTIRLTTGDQSILGGDRDATIKYLTDSKNEEAVAIRKTLELQIKNITKS